MPTLVATKPVGRTIREEQSYTESVKLIGGSETADIALASIMGALSNRPEGFDVVSGFDPIRIAKTDQVHRPGGSIPALRLWFVITGDTSVSLLYVEEIPDDNA